MIHKDRGLAPFKKLNMDRFPMWYGADPKVTEKHCPLSWCKV